jgi:hypothetical protein
MGNTKQNNYFDMRDYHVLDGRHDRYDDLSQTPVKKPPFIQYFAAFYFIPFLDLSLA